MSIPNGLPPPPVTPQETVAQAPNPPESQLPRPEQIANEIMTRLILGTPAEGAFAPNPQFRDNKYVPNIKLRVYLE